MLKIEKKVMDRVSAEAKGLPRKRMNYNIHTSLGDPVQKLFNAIEPGTYIRPHRHIEPGKTELFLALRGRAVAVQFDESGRIADHAVVGGAEGFVGVEFAPGSWHTFIAIEPGTVLFEVKEGPYAPNTDKNFAEWAPPEGDKDASGYIANILKGLGL